MNITLKSLLIKHWPFKKFQEEGSVRETIEELIEDTEELDTSLNNEEKTIIANVLKFKDTTADDLCVPRADITAAPLGTSYQELTKLFAEKEVTRMPIYRDTLDDLVGYIHIRDVLASCKDAQTVNYEKILQEVLFVAPSMRPMDLLLQMRTTRIPMAIVVDEFGGVDGLITAWDIINDIIGDIDELDVEASISDAPITRMSDGSALISARMDIEKFEKEFGPVLSKQERSEDEIDTVGGLVFSLAGRVPAVKEVIPHPNGLTFEILDADPRRIKSLRVRPAPKELKTE